MSGSPFSDEKFDNIQVVVMDGHMKRSQTVLLNRHTRARTHTRMCTHTHTYRRQRNMDV